MILDMTKKTPIYKAMVWVQQPSKKSMARALPKGHYIHPIMCDPLSYNKMVSEQKQWAKGNKSSFRFKKENRLRPYKKVVKTIPAYSTDLNYAKDQYDKRQEPW